MQRILVVDDSRETRKLLRAVLETDGYEVAVAGTVDEAVVLLPRFDPHLMVIDVRLPDGDGFGVAAQLRNHRVWRTLPIVAISAYGEGSAEMEARAAGCARFLRKPIEPRDLLSAVRGAIAGMRAARPLEQERRV
ncbi:MAG TPA: response regulator [Gemmatimonadaceae bacterium]|nr:response regulator [Gemmatimonadaceae bacterium]